MDQLKCKKMMDNVKMLVVKYKNFIMHAVFGILITTVNFISYTPCHNIFDILNIVSTSTIIV
mgnify:CR=1 FL=1